MTRRTFLVDLGRGAAGVVVLGTGLAACGGAERAPASDTASDGGGASPGPAGTTPAPSPTTTTGAVGDAVAWERVPLDFVSAYVLVRGGEAAVVDTGVEGSEGAIAEGLTTAGVGWDAVGHVVLTHKHPDHVGSLGAVVGMAPDATAYAGAEDIPEIGGDVTLSPVADGDEVFGLRIVATPGHTPGHVAVLDPVGGLLVAGDALGSADGRLTGPNPEFTPDMATALASVGKLADLDLQTVLVGHGEPVEGGDLAEQLRTIASG